jgi:hypothetical protein
LKVAGPTEWSLVVDPRDIGRGLLLLEAAVPERERIDACAADGCLWWFCASIVTLQRRQPLPCRECLRHGPMMALQARTMRRCASRNGVPLT